MVTISQINPKVSLPSVSGQVPGFGFVPGARRPREPLRPQRQAVQQDLNTAGGFASSIAGVLATTANVAMEVRQKRRRLADNETMIEATDEFFDKMRVIRAEEKKVDRVNDEEYFNAVNARGQQLMEDILTTKEFNDPLNRQQFKARSTDRLNMTLGQVDSDITKRTVAKHNANLATQWTSLRQDIDDGLLDIDGALNIYYAQVEAGLRDGAYQADRAASLKADFAQMIRGANVMRDFRANPDVVIDALENSDAYKTSFERDLHIEGQERADLIDDLKRKRKQVNSSILSEARRLAPILLANRRESGLSLDEYDAIRPEVRRADPKTADRIEAKEAIELDYFKAKTLMLGLVATDEETGRTGAAAMFANMDDMKESLEPTAAEGSTVTGVAKRVSAERFQAEIDQLKNEFKKGNVEFWDKVARTNFDSLAPHEAANGVRYDDLSLFEKVNFRENIQLTTGVKEEDIRYLTDKDITDFAKGLKDETDTVKRMNMMDQFFQGINPKRFYTEIDRIMNGVEEQDFLMLNMVDMKTEDRQGFLDTNERLRRRGEGAMQFIDTLTNDDKTSVRSAVESVYAANYGATFLGSKPGVKELYIKYLEPAVSSEWKLRGGSVDSVAKDVYKQTLGTFITSGTVGNGNVITTIPKKMVAFKSPQVLDVVDIAPDDVRTAARNRLDELGDFNPRIPQHLLGDVTPEEFVVNLKRRGNFMIAEDDLPEQNIKRGEAMILVDERLVPIVNGKNEKFVLRLGPTMLIRAQEQREIEAQREAERELLRISIEGG